MARDFVHLNVHTCYSLLSGASGVQDMVERARAHGYDALAITDTNGLYGATPFIRKAKESGLRPIIGAEIEHAGRSAVCLARNREGYANLCRIITARRLLCNDAAGDVSGGHAPSWPNSPEKPTGRDGARPSKPLSSAASRGFSLTDALIRHQEGLFILSPSPAVLRALKGKVEEKYLFREVRRFSDHDHYPCDTAIEKIPPVATNWVHFASPARHDIHRILTAIRKNKLLSEVSPLETAPSDAWLKSPAQMAQFFGDSLGREAMANTRRIAEACEVEIESQRPIFPRFFAIEEMRKRFAGETPYSALCKLALRGARTRYRPLTAEVMKRLTYELEIIDRLGFSEYFLIVWDIVTFAHRERIPIVGRGSAANSLVAYCLGITSVDPIAYKLYFERFLNLSRTDCPDIDLDLCWRRRDEVLRYVYQRYGDERVAMVCNHNTFQARSAFRDVARVFGLPLDEIGRLSARLPHFSARGIRESLEWFPEARGFPLHKEPYGSIVACAEAMDGFPRHLSIHSGGIVIADRPLTDYVPLERATKGLVITQYEKEAVEAIGLVKIDLLGHRTLSVIHDTVEAIERGTHPPQPSCLGGPRSVVAGKDDERGRDGSRPSDILSALPVRMDLSRIPDGDAKTAEALRAGRTIGCFQIESPGMRSLLQMLRAENRLDVIHALSLIRPGPSASGMKERFVRRRAGEEPVAYDHPRLAEALADTYGIMLFQEDILKVAEAVAGFTLEEGDQLRKAISKERSPERIACLRDRFVRGAVRRGATRGTAERIWDLVRNFAGYSYCKAHAVTYGHIAYQATWLKAHYPAEFLAAVMSNQAGFYAPSEYLEEARRWGVRILPPDVNRSDARHTGGGRAIRIGLAQVKGLAQRTLASILRARVERPFASLEDFLRRTGAGLAEVESLILCGAFGCFGETRPQLLWRLRMAGAEIDSGRRPVRARAARASTREDIFTPHWDRELKPALRPPPSSPPSLPEYPLEKCIRLEQRILDMAVSDHPLRVFEEALAGRDVVSSTDLPDHVGRSVTVAGWLVAARRAVTRNSEYMKFLTLEDRFGTMEVALFPKTYQRFGHRLLTCGPYLVRGKVESNHRSLGITAEWVDEVNGGRG